MRQDSQLCRETGQTANRRSRRRLIGERDDVAEPDGIQSLDHTDITRRMHLREMRDDITEDVVRHGARRRERIDRRRVVVVRQRDRVTVDRALAKVDAVDAQRLETLGHRVNLA